MFTEKPKYAQYWLLNDQEQLDEKERITTIKSQINHILDTETITLDSNYKYDLAKIKETTTNDLVTLARIFSYCITELRKDSKYVPLVNLFIDVQHAEVEIGYRKPNDPYLKKQLKDLFDPYVPEMKKLIIKCSGIFAQEEATIRKLMEMLNT
jgi:hypothetical protein